MNQEKEQILFKINEYKSKLTLLEEKLKENLTTIENKKKKNEEEDNQIQALIKEKGNEIIKINCSGEKHMIYLKTLLSIKDTLFTKILTSNSFDYSNEILFDRNPRHFLTILNYFRFKKIDFKRLSKTEKTDLRFESMYFEVSDLQKQLGEFNAKLEIVEFEHSGDYSYKGNKAGTGRVEDLSDKSLLKGICATSPGFILFTLNDEFKIKEIDVGGYCGNSSIWNPINGEGANIEVSLDKTNWNNIGSIPVGFGTEIRTVKIKESSSCKYIKFSSSSYLGIGYLNIRTE